jgi:hypothetical protein
MHLFYVLKRIVWKECVTYKCRYVLSRYFFNTVLLLLYYFLKHRLLSWSFLSLGLMFWFDQGWGLGLGLLIIYFNISDFGYV